MADNAASLTDRLRAAWRRTSEPMVPAGAPRRHPSTDKGGDFAARLRAAVDTRR